MNKPKILIVDDEPFNIDYLEQELADLGYDAVSATDGREALEQVATTSPDVILLDIMMPEMNGFQVLEQLKADKTVRHIPVIVISALHDLKSVVKGIELGADDYLPKPFDPVLLKARISACLEKKRLRDQEQLYLKALERELEIGRQIQASFLPDALPQIPGWEIAAHFQAAREVAGDFYDVFPLSRGERLGLVIGDVCDKGVGAALFMTLFRSLIRATANPDYMAGWLEASGLNPTEWSQIQVNDALILKNAVTLTNNYVARTHSRMTKFTTLFFGLLDPVTGLLTYLNGGHEPPVIIGQAGLKTHLRPTGPIVGLWPNLDFKIQETHLEPGDTLFAFTDGVTDAMDSAGERFTKEKLWLLLEQARSSPTDLLNHIEIKLQAHIAGADPYDDITMLAVRRVAQSAV